MGFVVRDIGWVTLGTGHDGEHVLWVRPSIIELIPRDALVGRPDADAICVLYPVWVPSRTKGQKLVPLVGEVG